MSRALETIGRDLNQSLKRSLYGAVLQRQFSSKSEDIAQYLADEHGAQDVRIEPSGPLRTDIILTRSDRSNPTGKRI